MMTPSVNHSFGRREVVLKQAISYLTGGQCSGWTGFNRISLLSPFQVLYRVCELNWLPVPDSDSMMKNRLRLLYDVAKCKPIDFAMCCGKRRYTTIKDADDMGTGVFDKSLSWFGCGLG
ncbi:unnamed protein product [Brassica oleracea var. botrytis]